MKEFVPELRKDIEITPTVHQGQQAFLFRDSLGLIQEPFLLFGDILHFLSLIDGKRNIRDIQLDLIRIRQGTFVSSEEVEKVIAELDSLFLLDSDSYQREKKNIISTYTLLNQRQAFHAGRSYPAERDKLEAFLAPFFSSPMELPPDIKGKSVSGLIAPHIDLKIGKRVYAKAYQAIKDCSPKRVLLLGTGHNLHEFLYSLTEKDFETPLGLIQTDKDPIRELRRAGDKIVVPDDMAHRSEHSIEFQLLFLQHLFGTEFMLIPILCGSFHEYLQQVNRPREIPGIEPFLETLRSLADESVSTLLVAGIDFSHIGLKFGHTQNAASLLLEAKRHDNLLLEAICGGDIEALWSEAGRVGNRYNVCGLSCLATLLEILPGNKGFLLDYDIWEEEATQSAVSFATVVMVRKE